VVGLFPETGPSQVRRLNGAELIIAKGVDWRLGRRTEGGVDDNGGSAARFFKCCPLDDEDADLPRFWYVPKASKADRDEGLDGTEERPSAGAVGMQRVTARNWGDDSETVYERKTVARNHHPTVKPTALMRYLCRLITPPGGVVLDPFMGSGSTGKAAVMEGFDFMGIEVEPEYYALAEARIAHAQEQHTPQLEFAL